MGKFKQIDIELKSLEEETNQTIYQHTLKTVDSILDIVDYVELKSLGEKTNQLIHKHTLKTVDAILDIVNAKRTSEDEQNNKGEV